MPGFYKTLFLLFLIITSSCRIKDRDIEGKTVFRYNETAGITSLDPAFARNQANIWAVNQLFNGLVQLDSALMIQPCIAKSWSVSPDGKTYTFFLRNDVSFHDHFLFQNGKGRKVTAKDFVFSLQRLADKSVASPGAWVMGPVAIENGKPAITSVDDTTLVIRLNNAFPPFLGMLSMQYCFVVPKEAISYFKTDFRSNPVGTGPFRFKLWKEGVKLVMLKNSNYFETENGKRLPYLDAVAVSFIIDKQTAFLEFI
ncbi:MAG: ABC transporter substrate-binding protein, partial [Lentimicrobium sp.]|nr:ABC transporter substrate-binding protein [Lentimicrobium sp.]